MINYEQHKRLKLWVSFINTSLIQTVALYRRTTNRTHISRYCSSIKEMFALALVEKADSFFLLWQPPRECPSLHDTSRDLTAEGGGVFKRSRRAASQTGYREIFLCGRKRSLQRAIYMWSIINCGENDHTQQSSDPELLNKQPVQRESKELLNSPLKT